MKSSALAVFFGYEGRFHDVSFLMKRDAYEKNQNVSGNFG
jgi:hypothetical protein